MGERLEREGRERERESGRERMFGERGRESVWERELGKERESGRA